MGIHSKSVFIFTISLLVVSFASSKQIELTACHVSRSGDVRKLQSFESKCTKKILSGKETALVIVDMWKVPGEENLSMYRNASEFLKIARKNKMLIVHGGGSAVFSYPKYQKYHDEVKQFMGADFCKGRYNYGGENAQKIYGHSAVRKNCSIDLEAGKTWHFSDFVKPVDTENEYLINYEDEMRYFLYKNKVKNLIYIGGALDECIMHRSYGINLIKGSSENASDIDIYIIADLVSAMPSVTAGVDDNLKVKVLLDSLSYGLADYTFSKDIFFKK